MTFPDARTWSSRPIRMPRDFDRVFRQHERTVDQMTPDDVRAQAAKKIDDLKRRIANTESSLDDMRNELAFWEGVK